MKTRLKRLILCMTWSVASCSFQYIDHPGPKPEDQWIKKNMTPAKIKKELVQCGFSNSSWNIQKQIDIDNCMLDKGFVFIDSSYGDFGSICKYPEYQQKLPSCLSMRRSR